MLNARALLRSPFRIGILALWSLFLFWTGTGIIAGMAPDDGTGRPPMIRINSAITTLFLDLDFWGFLAGLVFGLMLLNPLGWLNGKRLIIGSLAFAMILGRLIGGGLISGYLLLLFQVPASTLNLILFIGAPFALFTGGITVLMVSFILALIVFSLFVIVPVLLFSAILKFDNLIHTYRYQARGLANYIIRFMFWLRNEQMPETPPDDSQGARFATRSEITALYKAAPESMAFGHIGGAPLFLKTDKHILIMASTRSGKGVTLIIPHLLRYQGSAFVLDPKGENAKATGRQRARINQRVHYLDPFGVSGRPQSRFNPLSRFTPQNMETESKALATAIFLVEDRQRDHWTASGQQLLATIILYVYVSNEVPKEKKDLTTVRRLLLGGLRPALEEMVPMDDADGLLRELAMSFLETPANEFGSIVSTARRQTEILDNPNMIACLSATGPGPEVNFKDWHRGTMTVFLCLSAPKFPTFNRWLRLVLTSALDEMTDRLDPPKLPVCFMLDELATLGHLQSVENAVGLAAGYGIQLINVFQDIGQMRHLYKSRWSSFIGNAGVRALFNLDDHDTAEYWSKFIGSRVTQKYSRQEDMYGLSQGQGVADDLQPLLTSDQIMLDFASRKMLLLTQGQHPIRTDRTAYWSDGSLNGLWDDPRAPPRDTSSSTNPPPPSGPSSPGPSSPPPRPAAPGPAPQAPQPAAAKPNTVRPPAPLPSPPPRPAAPVTPKIRIDPTFHTPNGWGKPKGYNSVPPKKPPEKK